jgi:FkbH-like protein
MREAPTLHWLPAPENWREKCKAFATGDGGIDAAVALANTRLDFVGTNALDATVQKRFRGPPGELTGKPVRLAILGSSTLVHLHAAIRIGGLRRGIWIETYENNYGQYLQELVDPSSSLHAFKPDVVLFAFDARHLTQGLHADTDASEAAEQITQTLGRVRQVWGLARQAFGCPVLQQTVINVFPTVLGNNEHRLQGSCHRAVQQLNALLREASAAESVHLIALDDRIARDGLYAWYDPALWHRSKQEVSPVPAPVWGDLVGRVLAAQQGKSFKALVLDLDNTIWGGVIGDDGLGGIVLGQGSALGEGFVAVQEYAKELSRRGVILAVASKNDEANAAEPFEKHPEMVLRRSDIASFRADWNDKAGNLRAIAQELNIGIDALVLLDDNPFERALVREELPMVAVPEIPDDPALVPQILADAGYFEGVAITSEDRERTHQYQSNRARERLMAAATDLDGYLRALKMRMIWRPFDSAGLQRTVQLINKTNQFNLTTRRYSEEGVVAVMNDPRAFGLQLRLLDRFGDNGIIAIIIGRLSEPGGDLVIDTWLMSCRVLGRQVEPTTLNLIAQEAHRLGASRLIGEYLPTKKNGMVRDHYERLGFTVFERDAEGCSKAVFDLTDFRPADTFINSEAGTLL